MEDYESNGKRKNREKRGRNRSARRQEVQFSKGAK